MSTEEMILIGKVIGGIIAYIAVGGALYTGARNLDLVGKEDEGMFIIWPAVLTIFCVMLVFALSTYIFSGKWLKMFKKDNTECLEKTKELENKLAALEREEEKRKKKEEEEKRKKKEEEEKRKKKEEEDKAREEMEALVKEWNELGYEGELVASLYQPSYPSIYHKTPSLKLYLNGNDISVADVKAIITYLKRYGE